MIPIADENRQKGYIPWMTIFIIILCSFCFVFSLSDLEWFLKNFGFIPKNFLKNKNFSLIFSSMFLHGDFFHLLGNMWFLWIFGNNLERKLKRLKFLLFYLVCGVFSLIFYTLFNSNSSIPVVGASGAISGVLGGYFVLFPQNRITTIVPGLFFYQIISLPAGIFGFLWFLYQFFSLGSDINVAFLAHIGGFLIGALLIRTLYKKNKR